MASTSSPVSSPPREEPHPSRKRQLCSDSFLNTLKAREIENLAKRHRILGRKSPYKVRMPSVFDRACTARDNEITVYADALLGGLRLPFPQLFLDIFQTFHVCPSQLTPNSWRTLCGFVIVFLHCGFEPSVANFEIFFKLSREAGTDWLFFSARPSRHFLGSVPSFIKKWKEKYFFVSRKRGLGVITEWGTPPRTQVSSSKKLSEAEADMLLRLRRFQGVPIDDFLTGRILQRSGNAMNPEDAAKTLLARKRALAEKRKTARLEQQKKKSSTSDPAPEDVPASVDAEEVRPVDPSSQAGDAPREKRKGGPSTGGEPLPKKKESCVRKGHRENLERALVVSPLSSRPPLGQSEGDEDIDEVPLVRRERLTRHRNPSEAPPLPAGGVPRAPSAGGDSDDDIQVIEIPEGPAVEASSAFEHGFPAAPEAARPSPITCQAGTDRGQSSRPPRSGVGAGRGAN
ncbi:hypothetical protein J5N97_018520 [Dioscorea zingiberensis]|uniref:Transposase (putative) gypsy type domain-containing protein n=1 Tax=Dioscorea zingiberensis TaxID=325984 RepID=A0A9D5HBI9_9LILI|nr:hypothetical protein J5N97_018520 [Dioscorea zingiberensis]